jgi:hypothetical protein
MLFGQNTTSVNRALHAEMRERMPPMVSAYSDLFIFILLALAVGFMLWALWHFHKAERER